MNDLLYGRPLHKWEVAALDPVGIKGDEPIGDKWRKDLDILPIHDQCRSDKKDTNPKDAAASTRLDISVWPETASAYGALAMTEGDYKYGAYNYRIAGVQASVYVSALRRHMAKWYNGEWSDSKTGVPHLANALACIGVLIDAHEAGKLIDDRPPRIDIGMMFYQMEQRVKQLQQVFPPKDGPGRYTEEKHGDAVGSKTAD